MNDEQKYEIEMDRERKIYTSEIYDVTIIEMKEEDKIKNDSFFEFDDNIYNPDYNFKNKPIYFLHYKKGEGMNILPGLIKISVDGKYYEIEHVCNNNDDSSSGPIINSTDYKVIGIKDGSKEYNCCILLKEPIIEFKEQIKNMDNKINKNKIIDNIKKEDNLDELIDKNNKDNIDEITIKYKIDDIKDSKKIRIFGYQFVLNNIGLCKIMINKNKVDLTTHIDVNINQLNNEIFEVRLKGIKKVKDMSYMFHNCISLSSSPDISKWNTEKVTNMRGVFSM